MFSLLVIAKGWKSIFPGSLQKSKIPLNFEGHYIREHKLWRKLRLNSAGMSQRIHFIRTVVRLPFELISQICSFFSFYFHWKSKDFHMALQTIWCWKVFPRGNTILQEDCHMVSLRDILYISAEHFGWQN